MRSLLQSIHYRVLQETGDRNYVDTLINYTAVIRGFSEDGVASLCKGLALGRAQLIAYVRSFEDSVLHERCPWSRCAHRRAAGRQPLNAITVGIWTHSRVSAPSIFASAIPQPPVASRSALYSANATVRARCSLRPASPSPGRR